MATESTDVVIVGAGHNGLVTAAYLAKAGRRVLVLEARDRIGGAAVTEEIFPGFRFSTFADGSGYLSAHSRRQHFGLGAAKRVDELEIRWPSGQRTLVRDLEVDQRYRIEEDLAVASDTP